MRDTSFVASGMVLAFAALATTGCGQDGRNLPSGEANGGTREILTGVITDTGSSCLVRRRPCSRILVEEDPDAECGGRGGPPASGCEKTYFDVTRETDVFRKVGGAREAAPVAELRKGIRVSADSRGYLLMESYPSQTRARAVEIL